MFKTVPPATANFTKLAVDVVFYLFDFALFPFLEQSISEDMNVSEAITYITPQ